MIQGFLFALHQWLHNVPDVFIWSTVSGGSKDAICRCLESLAENKQLEIGLFLEGGWSPTNLDPILSPGVGRQFSCSPINWSANGTFHLSCCYNHKIEFTLVGLRDLPTVAKVYAFDGNRVLNLKRWSRVLLATFPFWVTRTAPKNLTRDQLRSRKRKHSDCDEQATDLTDLTDDTKAPDLPKSIDPTDPEFHKPHEIHETDHLRDVKGLE